MVYTVDFSWWVFGLVTAYLIGKAVAWIDASAARHGWRR